MTPLPAATLLWLARDLNDLALAKFERLVAMRPDEASRLALHADLAELANDWGWHAAALEALEQWRSNRERDAREKREDARRAAELKLDK